MKRVVQGLPVVRWVENNAGGRFGDSATGLGLETEDGRLVAAVAFNDFNGANMCIHVASDGSKNWLNKHFLKCVFDYAFNHCKVKRLTGIVPSSNIAARRFDEHLGFVEEARLKDAHPDGDLILYRMRKEDCRFLNTRSQNEQRFSPAAA